MEATDELLLAKYDEQVRGYVPDRAPLGAVVEREGALVRTHCGTHGTVRHPPLAGRPLGAKALIGRQQAAFAARCEPVEWVTYGHDPEPLDELLVEAGFERSGPVRTLLVAELDAVPGGLEPPRGMRVGGHGGNEARLDRLAAATGPHARALDELREDGPGWDMNVQVLESDARLVGAGWAEIVGSTEFVAVRGLTGPHLEFLQHWAAWARHRCDGQRRAGGGRELRYLSAEIADPVIADALRRAGFRALTTSRVYARAPEGEPPAIRPVVLAGQLAYQALLDDFEARFAFTASTTFFPGITEPPESVTWHVGDITDTRRNGAVVRDDPGHRIWRVQDAVERAVRSCVRPGEALYACDWHHQGYRFDPSRVGGPGQPDWPGVVCKEGDYSMLLTDDLRLGTFWHPWEESLCVFGTGLLAEVEDDITAVLPTVLRRGGRNVGNVWTYESGDR